MDIGMYLVSGSRLWWLYAVECDWCSGSSGICKYIKTKHGERTILYAGQQDPTAYLKSYESASDR